LTSIISLACCLRIWARCGAVGFANMILGSMWMRNCLTVSPLSELSLSPIDEIYYPESSMKMQLVLISSGLGSGSLVLLVVFVLHLISLLMCLCFFGVAGLELSWESEMSLRLNLQSLAFLRMGGAGDLKPRVYSSEWCRDCVRAALEGDRVNLDQ
jgi:hypothetical protein